MGDPLDELDPNDAGISIMTISGHSAWRDSGDCLRRGEERLGGCPIAALAEPDTDQVTGAVDHPVEIAPAAGDAQVRFIGVPALADLTAARLAELLGQMRGQLGFPVSDGLMGKDEPTEREHFDQITQAELISQTPEYPC